MTAGLLRSILNIVCRTVLYNCYITAIVQSEDVKQVTDNVNKYYDGFGGGLATDVSP